MAELEQAAVSCTSVPDATPVRCRQWLGRLNLWAGLFGLACLVMVQLGWRLALFLPLGGVIVYALARCVLWWRGRSLRLGAMLSRDGVAGEHVRCRASDSHTARIAVISDDDTIREILKADEGTGDPEFFHEYEPPKTLHAITMLWAPYFVNGQFLERNLLVPSGWGSYAAWGLIGVMVLIQGYVLLLRWRGCVWRVVPGRIDLMESAFFSRHPRTIKSIPLRDIQLRCDTTTMELTVWGGSESARAEAFDLQKLKDPIGCIRAILRSAGDDRPTPAIPQDQYLG